MCPAGRLPNGEARRKEASPPPPARLQTDFGPDKVVNYGTADEEQQQQPFSTTAA